ncbi:MAG: 2-C-methyl-D-erythritol 4-phosphate cytidylyltransferase [Candidatus Cloacimonetes bacterium]|nr:2-C-methyl-D-erythritol 4-phosphate cytidylyltransferase [Candidatus Cloacimonadota bacterium]MBL7086027.1 2-C-methyl-D-erythritol 4-phosphate cytidylyltransferase [Candidatus Cloacimonadota bacterium]
MKNKISAIITAAGKSVRMNLPVKKQFMPLAGKPIIIHTVEKFINTNIFNKILVVVNKKDREFAEEIFSEYKIPKNNFIIVDGGKTRQGSVFNALKKCSSATKIVVIHDGVRPFVKIEEIKEIVNITMAKGAVTFGIPVKNTIKKVEQNKVLFTLDRKKLWEILTPQAFKYELIYNAHKNAIQKKIVTNDDAELVEILGEEVFVLQGSSENIKITNKFDLKIAEAMLQSKNIE